MQSGTLSGVAMEKRAPCSAIAYAKDAKRVYEEHAISIKIPSNNYRKFAKPLDRGVLVVYN